jgi:DNA end-binding protein Ku
MQRPRAAPVFPIRAPQTSLPRTAHRTPTGDVFHQNLLAGKRFEAQNVFGPMRTIWNGSINFGLVNIPIGLAVAQQRKDVSFRTLHRECGTPIKQKRWCPTHERDVEADELVKGWEFAKGQYVIVEESDLEAMALTRSQAIEIDRFVPLAEVDPIYFDRTYYLAPADADAQKKPYVLLLEAMKKTELGAVGKFVLWGKENLCLIRPLGDSLALETLFFAEDVRERKEIDEAVAETKVAKAELEMAVQLVGNLKGSFVPTDFTNDYREQLRTMLEAKLAGKEITVPEVAETASVIDLMDALKQSVAMSKSDGKEPAAKPKARKRAAAR